MITSPAQITSSPRHPPGLYTLFFTEMGERCSYYGMRGLLLLGIGYVIIAVGAQRAVAGPVWPAWLLFMYLLHTMGELCVSPVGLSSITKLAPARIVGQVMGLWFMATALGNLMARLIAGESTSPGQMSIQFWCIALSAAGIAVLLMFLAKPIRHWMVRIN